MTLFGFIANGLLLFLALGGANIVLGRCYWNRPKTAQYVVGTITAITMIAPTAYAVYISVPELANLKYPGSVVDITIDIIMALMIFAAIASIYNYCFKLGDRHGRYVPNPNRTELEDDLPPMPAK